MSTKLERIAEIAKEKPEEKFTSLIEALKVRLKKFNLEIAEGKTKIIYFGSKAYYESRKCDS